MLNKGTILEWSVISNSREDVLETEPNVNLISFAHIYDDEILANDIMKPKRCHREKYIDEDRQPQPL